MLFVNIVEVDDVNVKCLEYVVCVLVILRCEADYQASELLLFLRRGLSSKNGGYSHSCVGITSSP